MDKTKRLLWLQRLLWLSFGLPIGIVLSVAAVAVVQHKDIGEVLRQAFGGVNKPYTKTPMDTPIVIAGGSFHGISRSDKYYWVKPNSSPYNYKDYSAYVDNGDNTNVALVRFSSSAQNFVPANLNSDTSKGWRITFSNKDSNFASQPQAARLCSFDNCEDPNTPISLDAHGNIFFVNLNHTILKEHQPNGNLSELWVHDTGKDCKSSAVGSDEENDCDFIADITVETANSASVPYYCPYIHCRVAIGKAY